MGCSSTGNLANQAMFESVDNFQDAKGYGLTVESDELETESNSDTSSHEPQKNFAFMAKKEEVCTNSTFTTSNNVTCESAKVSENIYCFNCEEFKSNFDLIHTHNEILMKDLAIIRDNYRQSSKLKRKVRK